MANPDPLPVLHEFLPAEAVRQIEPLGNAGGWSGSLLWRVTASALGAGLSTPPASLGEGLPTPPRQCCLRRWPEGTSPQRLHFIHQILTHAAGEGIDFVPAPMPTRSVSEGTLVRLDGHLWDLAPWLPGKADYHANYSRPRLTAAMQVLARFHIAAATLPSLQRASGIAPAFAERLDQVRQLLGGDLDRISAAVQSGLDAELDLRAGQLLPFARRLLPLHLTPLEFACRESLPLGPAIRDIHHDHVLFTADRVTGLVDFGALRIDTPLTDLARLVGSLVGDDQPTREFALNAYSQLRPLTAEGRSLIDLLDRSGLVLGGLNWLRWLYLDRRDMGPLPAILKRLDEVLARLHTSPT